MIEDPADLAAFFDTDDFAETFGYVLADQSDTADVDGIFQDAHLVAGEGDFAGVSTTAPVFTTARSSLPVGAGKGDTLTRSDSTEIYTVQDIQPDGTGMVRLILERQ